MITLYVYDKKSLILKRMERGDYDDIVDLLTTGEGFTFTPPPNYNHVWRWVDNKWVELPPINNPNTPYDDVSVWNEVAGEWQPDDALIAAKKERDQAAIWERIKATRLDKVTSGVYVESVDKWFHTDTVSATTYSTIAGMIALDNYEPVQWKVMDNTWLLLTEPLFKELQTAMSLKTNANYAVAEQHKAAMLQADNPLSYDYHNNWD